MTVKLPTPYERLIDKDGRISEVWFRYLSEVVVDVNAASAGAAKAWGHVTLAGTVATLASGYNVATVASTATGLLSVGLTVPFSSTSYAVNYGLVGDDSANGNVAINVTSAGLATTGFTLMTQGSTAGDNVDPRAYFFTCYGEQ